MTRDSARAGHHFPVPPRDEDSDTHEDGDSAGAPTATDTEDTTGTNSADYVDATDDDANADAGAGENSTPTTAADVDVGESVAGDARGTTRVTPTDIDNTGESSADGADDVADRVTPSVTWHSRDDTSREDGGCGASSRTASTRRQSTLAQHAPDTDNDAALTALDIDDNAATWLDAVHTDAHPPRAAHDLDRGAVTNLAVTGDLGREDNLALRALVEDADVLAANTDKDSGAVGTAWARFGDGEYDAPEIPGDAASGNIRLSKTGSYTISDVDGFADAYAAELALFRFLSDFGVAHGDRGFEISTLVLNVPLGAATSIPDDASTDALNLDAVAILLGECAEYEPEQYTPVVYHVARDSDAPSRVTHADSDVTMLIFPNGELVVTGVPAAHVADAAVEYLAERLGTADLL